MEAYAFPTLVQSQWATSRLAGSYRHIQDMDAQVGDRKACQTADILRPELRSCMRQGERPKPRQALWWLAMDCRNKQVANIILPGPLRKVRLFSPGLVPAVDHGADLEWNLRS